MTDVAPNQYYLGFGLGLSLLPASCCFVCHSWYHSLLNPIGEKIDLDMKTSSVGVSAWHAPWLTINYRTPRLEARTFRHAIPMITPLLTNRSNSSHIPMSRSFCVMLSAWVSRVSFVISSTIAWKSLSSSSSNAFILFFIGLLLNIFCRTASVPFSINISHPPISVLCSIVKSLKCSSFSNR